MAAASLILNPDISILTLLWVDSQRSVALPWNRTILLVTVARNLGRSGKTQMWKIIFQMSADTTNSPNKPLQQLCAEECAVLCVVDWVFDDKLTQFHHLLRPRSQTTTKKEKRQTDRQLKSWNSRHVCHGARVFSSTYGALTAKIYSPQVHWPCFVTRDIVVLWNSQTFISAVKTFHRKWLCVLICRQLSARKGKQQTKGPHLKKNQVTETPRNILIMGSLWTLNVFKWFTA